MGLVSNEKLFNALKDLGTLDEQELRVALELSHNQRQPLSSILLNKELISDENLGRVVSELATVPLVRLSEVSIADDVLRVIPEIVAKNQKIISFKKDADGLHLAMVDPSNIQIREFVEKKIGLPIIVYYATDKDLGNALSLYSKGVKQAFEEILSQSIVEAKGKTKSDPSIIKIVNTIVSFAYQNTASDIHIEPLDEYSLVRFRIDGVLQDVVKLPFDLHKQIITRIKILAKLRTDEHQAAQDGKFQYKADSDNSEDLDIRISIVPVTEGERVVMRLLSERSRQFSLQNLGFSKGDLAKIQEAYQKPHGMILATGPTGCGKTTSLYAILKLLNKRGVNIMTIEDPVEYDIENVNQIQINTKTDLTFAKGLRSIVRQDPDIILVGEIRDNETAGIAVNSAMTGHLVLSTLHTNDAATSFPRLLDMEVEPFLVASTVNVVVAQRLVRKIHKGCRVSKEVSLDEISKKIGNQLTLEHFGTNPTVRIYEGKGCKLDHGSGYKGRVGIFEVMIIDDAVRQAIVEKKDAAVIAQIAAKNGMTTMVSDGLEKVKQGLTTIEEITRVAKE